MGSNVGVTPTDDDPAALEAADRKILAIERPEQALVVMYAVRSLAALIFAPFVFIPFLIRYLTLRYRFDEEGVSAAWGILFRREIHLTYKRVQDIHVRRNVIERWLGIATVEVQTASGSQEAEIAIEGMRDYEDLRDFLYRRMRGHELGGASGERVAEASADTSEERVVALLQGIRSDLDAVRESLERRSP